MHMCGKNCLWLFSGMCLVDAFLHQRSCDVDGSGFSVLLISCPKKSGKLNVRMWMLGCDEPSFLASLVHIKLQLEVL